MRDGVGRLLWGVAGVGALSVAVSVGSWWLLTAWLVPDLGVLAGGWRIVDDQGRLSRAATVGYNATHALIGPAVVAALAWGWSSPWLAAVAVLWFSHVAIDRALGYRLRSLDA